jgi:mannitol-1-/sugar-/sorbitol-6-phosphatase
VPSVTTAVLFDVDGTLVDVVANQRRVWGAWARRHDLDPDHVWSAAVGTRPQETFASVAPGLDPRACLEALDEIENEDVRNGEYAAFDGARELLASLPPGTWALVTSNYARRVRGRFTRVELPMPGVVIDADAVTRGKPDPEGYLAAAAALGAPGHRCLVVEDGATGIAAGRSAAMTVWAVHADAALAAEAGAHRTFKTLAQAAPEILSWYRTTP